MVLALEPDQNARGSTRDLCHEVGAFRGFLFGDLELLAPQIGLAVRLQHRERHWTARLA